MTSEVHAPTRLSGLESVMWRLDADPRLRTTFGSVSFLERSPDVERFRTRLAAAIREVPRLRRRVQSAPLPGTLASWVDDPTFDLDRHLRWHDATDGTGRSDESVLEEAVALTSAPFDRDHPLWEIVIVTGLAGGRAALVQRMHHALTDGEGGIRLSERFVDISPDAPEPTPDPFPGGPAPEPPTTWGERAVLDATEVAGGLVRAGTSAARWAARSLTDPEGLVRAGGEAAATLRSIGRQFVVVDGARSPIWTERSASRRLLVGSVPFTLLRSAADRTGASINDLFVTAVVRGAGAYHRSLDRPTAELRVAVPVSTRAKGAGGDHTPSNAFAPSRAVLPTGDGLTAGAHLAQVAERLAVTTHEPSLSLATSLAGVAEIVPVEVLAALFRNQTATIDLVASNVRAAPFPLYVGGARIEATYALGPLMGTPVNVTMMTYDGRVDLGIHVDEAAVPDPERLRDNVLGALHEVAEVDSIG